jgi:hypothetical protein
VTVREPRGKGNFLRWKPGSCYQAATSEDVYIYIIHNSMALIRERTIPTERSPLVGEVNANFC